MSNIADFQMEKARKKAIGARDNLEGVELKTLDLTVNVLNDLKALMQMDYYEAQAKVQGIWEVYTCLSISLAGLIADLYQLDEPIVNAKLHDIYNEVSARLG